MAKSKQYTAEQFIEAIRNSGGIVSTIASRIGTDWHTAKRYIDGMPTVAQAYADECEAVLDLAESKLIMSIKDGNTQDAKWYLSKKGKSRGYGDVLQHEGSDGGPVVLRVEYVNKRADDNTTDTA